MSFSPMRGANSAPQNSLAEFEGPFCCRGGKKGEKGTKEGAKDGTERSEEMGVVVGREFLSFYRNWYHVGIGMGGMGSAFCLEMRYVI